MKKEFKAPKLVVKKIGAQQILAGSGETPEGVTAKQLTQANDGRSVLW